MNTASREHLRPFAEVMEEPVTKRRKVVTAVIPPATVRTTSRPLPAPKPSSPRESEAARTVRPRPLHVNEKVGVIMIFNPNVHIVRA